MTEMRHHYLYEGLTPRKLSELRAEVGAESDDELEAHLRSRWMGNDLDHAPEAEGLDMEAVWGNIVDRISEHRHFSGRMLWRWLQVAAVVLLPILGATIVYQYRENAALASDEITVSTGTGERATVTLPDGTNVTLNALSALRYHARTFNKDERQLLFDGEGYFDVRKDPSHPFVILSDGLSVEVLGTRFNLLSRRDEMLAKLTLEHGKVSFTAVGSGANATLEPRQMAVLDKSTGRIRVSDVGDDLQNATAWKHQKLVFSNTPLSDVVATIEKTYGVDIVIDRKINMNDMFTGVMPSNSLSEALEILEQSYHLKAIVGEKKITIR